MKLTDLPEHLRFLVLAELAKTERSKTTPKVVKTKTTRKRTKRIPTKTESEYERRFLYDRNARFEGITFRLANGHAYTPDFVWWEYGRLHAVEVKGSYRLGSYQRSRMAFDQARIDFPEVRWAWFEKKANGEWKEMGRP